MSELPIIAAEGCLTKEYMRSGFTEQERPTRYKHLTSTHKGVVTDWYVGIMPNEGDFVYARARDDKLSNGFGGAILRFPLEDGSVVEVQGPWHGNAGHLFRDTGYDARDKYYTQLIVGLNRHDDLYSVRDVIYWEKEKVLGTFERHEAIVKALANRLQRTVYYWSSSESGGCGGCQEPDSTLGGNNG